MTHELDRAFRRACDDHTIRVILLRADGTHFSSGHDLGTDEHMEDLRSVPYERGLRGDFEKWESLDVDMCLRWRHLAKPGKCL